MTISRNQSDGTFTAREGADFVVSHSAKSAEAKLLHTIKKRGRTHATWVRRRSVRDQSLASRFVRRRD